MTKSSDALASFDHESSCWRTSQGSLLAMLDASSDVFSGPWPRSGTMRNGVCYPQPTLARPTDASGSGSWPTPDATNRVRDEDTLAKCAAFRLRNANQKTVPLYLAEVAINWATPTTWPTPNRSDYKGAMTLEACKTWEFRGTNLPEAAVTWSTPRAEDGERGAGSKFDGLSEDARDWATPRSRDWKDTPGMATTGTNPDGSQRERADQLPRQVFPWAGLTPCQLEAQTTPSDSSPAKPRRAGLNPRFGLWLMGYPAAWLDCVESGTPSSRSVRLKSSAPSQSETL